MKKHLNFYFPCIEDGGLEKNVFALVNSLARKNYKINFFTYEDATKLKKLKKKFFFHKKINVIESAFFFNINRRYLKYLFCSLRLFFFLYISKRYNCLFSRKCTSNNYCKNYIKKNNY